MARKWTLCATLITLLTLTAPADGLSRTVQDPSMKPHHRTPAELCWRITCKRRVAKKAIVQHWHARVQAYGPGLLQARVACESLSSGGYNLSTTGNGFWFAHQFTPPTWHAAGGRLAYGSSGRPVGVWSPQPSRLEQDFRAVVADEQSPGDPWPNCP
jgi:hypothetical protein